MCKEWEAVVYWTSGATTTRRGHESAEEAGEDVGELVEKFGELFGPVEYTEVNCVEDGNVASED